jgi:hypothetical protein
MRARLILVPTLLLAVTACASGSAGGRASGGLAAERAAVAAVAPPPAPAPAPTADPVGRWTISLEAQGQMVELVMDIQKAGEGYTGSASSNMFPTMALSRVVLTGNRLVVDAPTPMGTVATFDMLIEGDNISGEWATSGMGSRVTGRRLR